MAALFVETCVDNVIQDWNIYDVHTVGYSWENKEVMVHVRDFVYNEAWTWLSVHSERKGGF